MEIAHCYGENHFVFAQLCSPAPSRLPTVLMSSLCQHRAVLSKTQQPHTIHGQSGKGFPGDWELRKEN